MDIKPLFPTPLITLDLADGGGIVADLRTRILARAAETQGVSRSNDGGGWQSGDDFTAWGGDSGALAIAAVREAVDCYTVQFDGSGLRRGRFDWAVQCWANVNRAGASNMPHVHPGAFWSACLYVDDGGIAGGDAFGGAIEFCDPRGAMPLMTTPNLKIAVAGCVSAGLGERIFPHTGMVLIFPAWLPHAVTRYTGSGTRVSLAMNFSATTAPRQ
jgi:uncharacterized protein (TIGR02466 family)